MSLSFAPLVRFWRLWSSIWHLQALNCSQLLKSHSLLPTQLWAYSLPILWYLAHLPSSLWVSNTDFAATKIAPQTQSNHSFLDSLGFDKCLSVSMKDEWSSYRDSCQSFIYNKYFSLEKLIRNTYIFSASMTFLPFTSRVFLFENYESVRVMDTNLHCFVWVSELWAGV